MASTLDGHPPAGSSGSTLQVRVINIALTGVNIFSAAAMAIKILWDTRNACMKRRRLRRGGLVVAEEMGEEQNDVDGECGGGSMFGLQGGQRISASGSSRGLIRGNIDNKAWWEMIPMVEVFPLILAVTIFVQGAMFAAVEGIGLDVNFLQENCRYLSEIAWVALWITPYIVLSLTIETAIRALSQPRFRPRSGRSIVYCILSALALTIFTWIPSRIIPEDPEQDICNGDLMYFVDQFSAGGLGIIAALLPISIFMGGVVLIHLSKDVAIDRAEKMASSRTVYFMIINVIQWILMVPNYVLASQGHPQFFTSELATVTANISGIIASGLYICLRTRALPKKYGGGPTIVHLGADRPGTKEKDPSIVISGPHAHDQRDCSVDDQPALASILSEYYDHTISDTPRSPTTIETSSIPRTPRSPTSIYSKDYCSSHAPSLISQYTTHSFKRLGDEINHMIAGLRSAGSPTAPKKPPIPPATGKPASNYSIFPPCAKRPRTPAALGASTVLVSRPQVPLPARTSLRPPARPSREAVPAVNMDRRQSNYKLCERVQPQKLNSASHTLQVPKPLCRAKPAIMPPARPFEVAIPPRQDKEDAESFMEILIWKRDNESERRHV